MELRREVYSTGKKKLVLADFNKLIKMLPDEDSCYISRGWFYRDRQKWKLALADFNKAIKLSPTLANGYVERGLLYHKLSSYNEALLDYQKVLDLDEKDSLGYLLIARVNIGLIKYEKGFIDQAIKQWQQAVNINNSAEAQLALAVALYVKGEQEKAFEMAETALKLDREFANLKYLQENLWARRLLTDAAKLLSTPRIKDFLSLN